MVGHNILNRQLQTVGVCIAQLSVRRREFAQMMVWRGEFMPVELSVRL